MRRFSFRGGLLVHPATSKGKEVAPIGLLKLKAAFNHHHASALAFIILFIH